MENIEEKNRKAKGKAFTKENASEMGRRGGLKSAEVRKEKKKMKEMLELMMDMPVKKGKIQEFTNLEDAEGKNMNIQASILVSMIKAAQEGDVKAATFIRDTMGQKQKEAVEIETTGKVEVSLLSEILEQLNPEAEDGELDGE